MMKPLHIIIYIGALALQACSLNVPIPDQYADPDAIHDTETGRSLLASCYLSFPHYDYELAVLSTDFCPTPLAARYVDNLNLYNWQDKQLSSLATSLWEGYYTCISNCDALLERQDGITADTEAEQKEKAAIIAEAKTLKALAYFDLLRLFATRYTDGADKDGIVLKSMFGFETLGRSSKQTSTNYINSLLAEAATVENASNSNGWLSQRAVSYLQTEMALYTANYTRTAQLADSLIALAPTSLLGGDNYGRLWSTETFGGRIFAFNTSSSFYTDIQYDASQGDYFALSPSITYDEGDARKAWAVYPMEMNGEQRQLFGKYNKMNKQGTQPTYINRMRHAGLYFMAAEAYARLDDDLTARQRLNAYLTLVGAEPVDASVSGNSLIEKILNEKRKEFVGEATGWFDLKRISQDIDRLGTWGKTTSSRIAATDYRWTLPIPASEYKYNDNMTQNEGWNMNK